MKKFLIFFSFFIFIKTSSVYANNTYHGIDIDEIYNTSDWNSKNEIKNLIDNYILLTKLKNKFSNCPINTPDSIACYDEINQKLLQHFYMDFDENLTDYNNYRITLTKAYLIPCQRIKMIGISGKMCHIDAQNLVAKKLKEYTKTHIYHIDNILSQYFSFLHSIKL